MENVPSFSMPTQRVWRTCGVSTFAYRSGNSHSACMFAQTGRKTDGLFAPAYIKYGRSVERPQEVRKTRGVSAYLHRKFGKCAECRHVCVCVCRKCRSRSEFCIVVQKAWNTRGVSTFHSESVQHVRSVCISAQKVRKVNRRSSVVA